MKHVGLNLVYLIPGRTGGMETVARELIPALARERPGLRLTAFVNRETAAESGPWRDACEWVVLPVRASHRADWVRGEHLVVPRAAAAAGVDLLHSLGATAPAWGPFRRVVTIHDFTYRVFPQSHNRFRGRGLDAMIRIGAHRAHRLMACSEATRRDAGRYLGVDPAAIDVVPGGAGATAVAPTPAAELRERLGIHGKPPLIITFSDRRPHKNLARLVAAVQQLAPRPLLVIAGNPTAYERDLRVQSDVRLLPWVSDADREGLYALADVFAFPSLHEGFGLPVLEAMARGVPVACSNAGSLPEVAGDAALMFEPTDVGAIARALREALGNTALADAGREQAARFTWERAARLTFDSYERALDEYHRHRCVR